jgi:hypothetical protein
LRKLASLEQVNTPLSPPVEMMYFFLAATSVLMIETTPLIVFPVPQFSEPHSPFAKARVTTLSPKLVMVEASGSPAPTRVYGPSANDDELGAVVGAVVVDGAVVGAAVVVVVELHQA